MGKKAKKKARNTPQSDRRDTSESHGSSIVQSNQSDEAVDGVVVEERKKSPCKHIDIGVDLEKISGKISSRGADKCDDCREGTAERKGRSKHGKKGVGSVGKRKDSKSVWVCLQCGHFSCGGVGMPTTPQCHAIGHYKKTRHPYVVQLQNPNLCWCFPCNSLIPIRKSDQENGDENNVLLDIVKLIKAGPSEGPSDDVEDIWFGSGNVGGATSSGKTESSVSDRKEGYVARGLSNLGNTCFFNSVMQNLLAMNQLRNYFLKLNCSIGPLTMALKKLFAETSCEANSRHGINPKNLFGCICSKAPQFRGYQQQDSHELLRCLLDGLSTEELNMKKSVGTTEEDGSTTTTGSTFVDAIFGGQLASTVSCVECNYTSVVHEPFLDLSLPVPTKKSPSKKAPVVSRYRNAKPPLKYEARKGGKKRGKGKTDTVPVLIPCTTSSSETIDSSSLASSSLPGEEEKMCSSLASSSVPLEDENVDSSLASCSFPLKDGKVDSADNNVWLDYLGEDMSSSALDSDSPDYDILTIQISENKQTSEGDGVLQDSSESQNQVFSQNTESKQNLESPKETSSGDNLPLLQGSEVILLPYKDEGVVMGETVSKECEVSSPGLDYEQEVDFEGLGDLFNEPEMASVPNSDDKSSQDREVRQASFVAALSSESDPDEVDDGDAPVSINSCLACFTKPELLTGEHAWHCENCSKTLQGPQLQSRENQTKTTVESKSSENGYLDFGVGSTIEGDEDLQSTSTLPATLPITNDSNNQAPSFNQASGSCSVNDFSGTESHDSQGHYMVSNSKVKTPELDGTGGDGKSLKVMRDATKKILINKAPPVLTIHLKRFSQDARGRLSKLSGHVTFPDKIDLNPYMSPRSSEESKREYHLIGVVEHAGTMRGGHYVAYVRGEGRKLRTEQDNDRHTWFYASDAHVREVSLADVFRSEAYILFYERV